MPDLDRVSDLIKEVAATIVLPRFRHLGDDEVMQKAPGDLVTIADQESERALTAGLTALLPGSVVVGEEATAADPGVLDRVSAGGSVWIVDPVDGTNNFAGGREPFAIMVALVRDGETVAGWIYDPPADHMTIAESGSGAFRDGVRIKARVDSPPAADLNGVISRHAIAGDMLADVLANASAFGSATAGRHCAGWEYPAVALDLQQFALFWRLMPWDHAPGALIVQEAGGVAAHLDGEFYRPGRLDGGVLVAPNMDIWETTRDILMGPR